MGDYLQYIFILVYFCLEYSGLLFLVGMFLVDVEGSWVNVELLGMCYVYGS